jgi:hypothetical protein
LEGHLIEVGARKVREEAKSLAATLEGHLIEEAAKKVRLGAMT